MRNITNVLAAFFLSAMLVTGSQAAPPASQDQAQPRAGTAKQDQAQAKPRMKQVQKEMIGMNVQDSFGDKLGEITDFLFTMDDSKIRYALVSTEDLVGLAQDVYVVPWQVMQYQPEQQQFAVDITVDRFRLEAPTEESLACMLALNRA